MNTTQSMWKQSLNGETISHFVATERQADVRCIDDRRRNGLLYSIERIDDAPLPYKTTKKEI